MLAPTTCGGARARSIALVGTYPPTACGVATFTSNLCAAIAPRDSGWAASVVRVLDRSESWPADEVVEQWVVGDASSLKRSQRVLNSHDVVLLQHEYGLFGGRDGEDVLELIDGLSVPLVAVLHTALVTPSAHQREILEGVLGAAVVVVVQSHAARRRVLAAHDTDPDAVVVIPHGATVNLSGPALAGMPRPAVLTWGLLSPGKGIEHGIDALARLRHRTPAASYIVAGQTHPKVRSESGECYREALHERAHALGVHGRVCFDDAYRDWDLLWALVRSVDVVLLPYDSRDQVSSGVLVEALASARPVVATRFPHAEELLADGAGILVDHGDVGSMADALERVLYEPGLADQMGAAARRVAAPMSWPAVGAAYRLVLQAVAEERAVA